MQVQKTAQGKVTLYPVDGGRPIERWPVQAKAMVACGEFSLTPVEGADKGEDGKDGTPQAAAPRDFYAVEFTPVITPSMDVVAGASSPIVPAGQGEAVLGASIAVTTLPGVETVTLGQTGAGASTHSLPGAGDGLPTKTPLGVAAVHDKAPSAGKADQPPVRTSGRK